MTGTRNTNHRLARYYLPFPEASVKFVKERNQAQLRQCHTLVYRIDFSPLSKLGPIKINTGGQNIWLVGFTERVFRNSLFLVFDV